MRNEDLITEAVNPAVRDVEDVLAKLYHLFYEPVHGTKIFSNISEMAESLSAAGLLRHDLCEAIATLVRDYTSITDVDFDGKTITDVDQRKTMIICEILKTINGY